MKYAPREYQVPYIDGMIDELKTNDRVILQMPTGAGKTFTAIAIISEWMKSNPNKKVVFSAHRMELVNQFVESSKDLIGANPFLVTSEVSKACENSTIYACMVETLDNRLKSDNGWINGDIGLLVFDESHMNLFDRIHGHYADGVKVVGITATPISSNYLKPINSFYQSIVTNLSTKDVIDLGFLCKNKTYVMSSEIDLDKVSSLGGEYNNRELFNQYKKSKNVENTVRAYEKKAYRKKTIIFNCNIEHCELVNDAFLKRGYDSKVLYGSHTPEERSDILEWFRLTPNAILHNVGVLVAGYDEPSIECVIFNRDTQSLSLWLQATGRGSRIIKGKKNSFIIIDMGSNALRLGDWDYDYDWNHIFSNPIKKLASHVQIETKKPCIKCKVLINSKLNKCPECGENQNQANTFRDMRKLEFDLLSDLIDDKYNGSHNHRYSF